MKIDNIRHLKFALDITRVVEELLYFSVLTVYYYG